MDLGFTEEERQWLGIEPSVTEIPRKRFKAVGSRPIFVGELAAVAISFTKGKNQILMTDKLLIDRLQYNNTIRLRNQRTKSECATVSAEYAKFLARLMDMKICTLTVEPVYVPDPIRTMDEIIVCVKVYFLPTAFEENGAVIDTESLRRRKLSLELLFEKIGLMQPTAPSKVTVQLDSDGDELNENEVSRIYAKAGALDHTLEKVYPPDGFGVQLRDYQAKALSFMLKKEHRSDINSKGMSPLWKEFKPNGDENTFYYNTYSGELTLKFPTEQPCQGGILADDMGLGKTIEALCLIYSNQKKSRDYETGETSATLVVCPLNLLSQWEKEAIRCFPSIKRPAEAYYGSQRASVQSDNLPLIVLTTYGILAKEFEKAESSLLFQLKWHRVILDEAHLIKEKSTQNAKSAYSLQANNRWALTGTPIINKLDDLYSLIKFLRVPPWCQYSFWNSFVTTPFLRSDPAAINTVQTILEPLIIRRTKDMTDSDGNPIVPLPPKVVEIEYLEFSEKEAKLYESVNLYSKNKLAQWKLEGKADYTHVFSLLLKLRQICNHHGLINQSEEETESCSQTLKEMVKTHGEIASNNLKVQSITKQGESECEVTIR